MARDENTIEKIAAFMGNLVWADYARVRDEHELGVASVTVVDQEMMVLQGLTVEGWDNIEYLYEFLVGTFPDFL